MDPGIYGLIGLLVVETAGVVVLFIRQERSKRVLQANGSAISHTGTVIEDLIRRIQGIQGRLELVEQDRDRWQLRALQCEERERTHSGNLER